MLIRCALAAIDHNSNTDREQATTSGGLPRFDLVKQRHGKKHQGHIMASVHGIIIIKGKVDHSNFFF